MRPKKSVCHVWGFPIMTWSALAPFENWSFHNTHCMLSPLRLDNVLDGTPECAFSPPHSQLGINAHTSRVWFLFLLDVLMYTQKYGTSVIWWRFPLYLCVVARFTLECGSECSPIVSLGTSRGQTWPAWIFQIPPSSHTLHHINHTGFFYIFWGFPFTPHELNSSLFSRFICVRK